MEQHFVSQEWSDLEDKLTAGKAFGREESQRNAWVRALLAVLFLQQLLQFLRWEREYRVSFMLQSYLRKLSAAFEISQQKYLTC